MFYFLAIAVAVAPVEIVSAEEITENAARQALIEKAGRKNLYKQVGDAVCSKTESPIGLLTHCEAKFEKNP